MWAGRTLLLGTLIVAVVVVGRRRSARGGYIPAPSAALDAARLWQRALSAAGIVVLTALFFIVLGWIVDLPDGYGTSQWFDADQLKELDDDRWEELAESAARDALWYAPGYALFGVLLVLLTAHRHCVPSRCRLSSIAASAIVLFGVAGVADVVETLMFRTSLQRLIDVGASADLGNLPSVTQAIGYLKWAAALAAFVGLLFGVVWSRRSSAESAQP